MSRLMMPYANLQLESKSPLAQKTTTSFESSQACQTQGKHYISHEDVARSPHVSITHDGWTNLNTESFFTTTVHFINDVWVLKSAVLGTIRMTGSHTSERIADELRVTQQRWSLLQPIATTDNAANGQKAYQILVQDRYGCHGHRINLVVKKLLDIPEVRRIVGKVRKLVIFFHQSTSISDLLRKNSDFCLTQNKT